MNIWKISLKNLLHRPLYAVLAIVSLSISIGLLLGIQQLDGSIRNQFENGLGNVELVVGAKGSPLQLVLSSVLHIDQPTGNIPYPEVERLAKNPLVKAAVPISYGDNYKGYRIVGSTPGFATLYGAELLEGRAVKEAMEVIIGNEVAQELGLRLGDTFLSSHGFAENALEEHDQAFTVVGIYKPTYKVIDRLICSNLKSIWDVHDHGKGNEEARDREENGHHPEGHDESHETHAHVPEDPMHGHELEDKEVTSILLTFRNPMGLLTLPRTINKDTNLQAALPKYELERLFRFTGIGVKAISWIAYIILVISCMTIFIGLYKMVRERAFDLALMRTYGAGNFQLACIVGFEGLLMVLASVVLGLIFSQVGLQLLLSLFKSQIQQGIALVFSAEQTIRTLLVVFSISVLSVLMALLPLLRMNISKVLSDEK
ncbi:ABC transporter permease [Pseudozobellia thermophila]|uniref:Putative ABC transport system permease protein n=1 Tax=Pseudozobellia thermophila TaxID=192903 RepID=A0A1M6MNE7_9FLAO|nr:ABC transporter permease [Pseudozobellia thermophila]SHJ84964.1 putative ABC transport system permease protein [Pseudozobellia thermophila]